MQVIEANVTNDNSHQLVEPGVTLEFTYSANWYPTDIDFDDRFEKYLDDDFFEHQVCNANKSGL